MEEKITIKATCSFIGEDKIEVKEGQVLTVRKNFGLTLIHSNMAVKHEPKPRAK